MEPSSQNSPADGTSRPFGEIDWLVNAVEREELKRSRKEVRMLRMEKEILKKASQHFANEMK